MWTRDGALSWAARRRGGGTGRRGAGLFVFKLNQKEKSSEDGGRGVRRASRRSGGAVPGERASAPAQIGVRPAAAGPHRGAELSSGVPGGPLRARARCPAPLRTLRLPQLLPATAERSPLPAAGLLPPAGQRDRPGGGAGPLGAQQEEPPGALQEQTRPEERLALVLT